ncbi:MAG TPA: toll/interleukin-1 receptor domain-containing protein [Solirubrobacterales bacterium]
MADPIKHDAFICHASEDKDEVARPLALELIKRGFDVWFDEFTLEIGDSLLEEIDRGLNRSRYGVVILSERFFEKDWPRKELDGLVARETSDRVKRILPVWHGIRRKQVEAFSPTLAGRLAGSTSTGMKPLADAARRSLGACAEARDSESP